MRRRKKYTIPGLNTASLPDLIFTVLFFFMIVTHMRKEPLKVKYKVPAGTELTRLTKKSTVTYIYIGRPMGQPDGATQVQMNDKFVTVGDIVDYISRDRAGMSAEDLQQMTVSIKADKATPMGIITDVKQALRQANALRINYSGARSKEQGARE